MVYRKTYFVCQTFDIPPGTLDLGHVIASPSTPEYTLNGEEREVPSHSAVFASSKRAHKIDLQDARSESSGLFAIYLRLLGLSSLKDSGRNTQVTVEEMQTRSFQPDFQYLERSLESPGVARFLSASRYKKPVYVVTGVKIARGANFLRQKQDTVMISAEVPGITDVGIPFAVGPQAQMSSMSSRSRINFEGTSDFVFAYTLKKIHVTLKRQIKEINDFTKGALLGDENYSGGGHLKVNVEDAGADGLSNVVAETLNDDDDNSSSTVALYSAKD